jgi:hypothetical protein
MSVTGVNKNNAVFTPPEKAKVTGDYNLLEIFWKKTIFKENLTQSL